MKKILLSSVALLMVAISISAQKTTKAASKPAAKATTKTITAAPEFKNLLDSFSYAAGFNVATNMQAQGISKLNTALMQKGIDDVFKKKELLMSQEVINACMQQQLEIFNNAIGSTSRL